MKRSIVVLASFICGSAVGAIFINPIYNKIDSLKDRYYDLERSNVDELKFKLIQSELDEYSYKLFKTYYGNDAENKFKEFYNENNRANQLNPNNDAYWQSRGYDERPDDWEDKINDDNSNDDYTQDELDNHANQLNANNDAYWESRGYDERPDNWQERSAK